MKLKRYFKSKTRQIYFAIHKGVTVDCASVLCGEDVKQTMLLYKQRPNCQNITESLSGVFSIVLDTFPPPRENPDI